MIFTVEGNRIKRHRVEVIYPEDSRCYEVDCPELRVRINDVAELLRLAVRMAEREDMHIRIRHE